MSTAKTSTRASLPATTSENLRGSAYMVAGMFGFAVNDVISKGFSGQLNVGQFMLVRGLIATVLVFALASYLGQMRPLSTAFRPLVALRGMGEAIATVLFVTALFHMPIANVSAVMQALPLALTLFAAFFYGETIGWRRITAVLVGFLGVMLIIRPGYQGFSIYSLYVVGAVAACVVRDLVTRNLGNEIPALFITFVTALFVTLTGAVLALTQEWLPVKPAHIMVLSASSLFLLAGYYFTVVSMRVGDIGFVAPFRYSILLFTMIGGAIVYQEYPDMMTLAGAAIVVATGIYTLYRERVVHRQSITQVPTRP